MKASLGAVKDGILEIWLDGADGDNKRSSFVGHIAVTSLISELRKRGLLKVTPHYEVAADYESNPSRLHGR